MIKKALQTKKPPMNQPRGASKKINRQHAAKTKLQTQMYMSHKRNSVPSPNSQQHFVRTGGPMNYGND